MMGDYVIIYDSYKDDTTRIAKNRAPEVGAKAIGVASIGELERELTALLKSGAKIDRLLFYTHGEPGVIFLGTSNLTSSGVYSLAGKGFEHLFLPDARINFDGCNIAEVKKGCEVGTACANTDNGAVFLTAVAKTFLFKAGGRVVGWDSAGWGFSRFGGSVMHHWNGNATHVFINNGGSQIRYAVGRQERPNPLGRWEVEVDKQIFYYRFDQPNKVGYTDKNKYRAGVSTPLGKGTWKMDGTGLNIAWETGEKEIWDVPLFSEYQTGTAFDTMGFDLSVVARTVPLNF
jgi:hypothetical protein